MDTNRAFRRNRWNFVGKNDISDALIISKNITSVINVIEKSEIPSILTVHFCNDYDIYSIHRIILSKLHYDLNSEIELKRQIAEKEEELRNARTLITSRICKQEIAALKTKILEICNSQRIENYKNTVEPILERYRVIPKSTKLVDIMTSTNIQYVPNDHDLERIKVIREFLNVVREIIPVDMVCTGEKSSSHGLICQGCASDLIDVVINSDGCQICPNCGVERYVTGNYADYIEGEGPDTIPSPNTRGYEDIINFKKTLYRYQGKQIPRVDMTVLIAKLDGYFVERNKQPGHVIKNMPGDSKGRKRETSVAIMLDALSTIGYSSCYEDVNYILNQYWGWDLPDVSHLEELILSDYCKTQKVWKNMTDIEKGRKSSVSTQYRLMKHLQLRGHICHPEDFKLPQPSSIRQYDEVWRVMCEYCNDPEIYFIPT